MTTPATAAQVLEFEVAMTCEGCSGAIERILGRMKDKGVEKVEIDLASKKVFVTATLSSDEVLDAIKKAGKETKFIGVKMEG